jgi:hypothetical protein
LKQRTPPFIIGLINSNIPLHLERFNIISNESSFFRINNAFVKGIERMR